MKLFLENGYLDMAGIIRTGLPFIFVVGGRATGKTYGALDYVLEHDVKFLFMRRTQNQIDLVNKPDFSPFKSVSRDRGMCIMSRPVTKYNAAFYNVRTDADGNEIWGVPIGYSLALSTVSSLRGFDASDCELLIYDEFIKEPHDRPLKEEGKAFLNAIETIGRNRELSGKPPLQVLCLANSNEIGNPIFLELGLVPVVEKMIARDQSYRLDRERGIGIFLISDSAILRQKENTSLYKLAQGSDFADMALKNQFAEMKYNSVCPQPLAEYRPLCSVGDITVYRHKSEKRYYCSRHRTGDPESFAATETDIKRWLRKYGYLWDAYMKKMMLFEDVTAEVTFRHYTG